MEASNQWRHEQATNQSNQLLMKKTKISMKIENERERESENEREIEIDLGILYF